jgi:hypothetical protein
MNQLPINASFGEKLVNIIVAFPHSEREYSGASIIYYDVDKKIVVFRQYDGNIVHVIGLPFVIRTLSESKK